MTLHEIRLHSIKHHNCEVPDCWQQKKKVEFIFKTLKFFGNYTHTSNKKYNKKRDLKLIINSSVNNNQQEAEAETISNVASREIIFVQDSEFYSLKLLHQKTCNFQNEQLL